MEGERKGGRDLDDMHLNGWGVEDCLGVFDLIWDRNAGS
jgi:hypothetical protein